MPLRPEPLTPRQKDVLNAFRDYRATHGDVSPTIMELADLLGLSKTSVHEHIEALVRKGHLRRGPDRAYRAYEPVEEVEHVPLAGAIHVVDTAFAGKRATDRVGTLQPDITTGLRRLRVAK